MRNAAIHILIFLALSSLTCNRKTLPDAPETKSSASDGRSAVTPTAPLPIASEKSDDLAADSAKEVTPRPTDKKKAEAQPESERYVTASIQLSPPPTQAQKEEFKKGLATIQGTDWVLWEVLKYLARLGNVSIVLIEDDLSNTPVTLDVEKTNWRMALETVARKFSLHVDDSRIGDHVIVLAKARESQEESAPAKPIPPLPDPTAEEMKTQVWVSVQDRPLGAILDYLARSGGHTLLTPDEGIREMKATLHLGRAHWRVVLDMLALKYDLKIDESRADERVLTIRARQP